MTVKDVTMKRRWGMAIDLDKCIGCGQCAVACAQENNMPIFEDDSDYPKRVAFLELMKVTNDRDAKFPDVKTAFIPKMCQMCEGNDPKKPEPPCVFICPVVATDVGDDGVVSQIWSRCIGCRYCQAACPFEARVFNWWKPRYEGAFKNSLNSDVSISSRGTIVKCTFCSHRWKQARDKAVAEGNLNINAPVYKTACQTSCPVGAIVFGDLDEAGSELAGLVASERAIRLTNNIDDLPEDKKNAYMKVKHFVNPKVYYLTSQEWLRKMMRFKKNS